MPPMMSASYAFAFATALAAASAPAAPEGANAFCVTGLVVHATPTSLILQRDDGANLYIQTSGTSPAKGDLAVLSGTTRFTRFNDFAYDLADFKVIGHGTVTPPREVSIEELLLHRMKNERVSLQAEIEDYFIDEIDARFYCLSLKSGPHRIYGAIGRRSTDITDIDRLLGARMRLTGTIHELHAARTFSGNRLFLHSLSRQQVIAPPETDLAKLPPFEAKKFSLPLEVASLSRHKVEGTVLAAWNRKRILVRATDGQVVGSTLSALSDLPRTGQSVVVAGYPTTDTFHILLSGGKWQPSQRPAMAEPAAKNLRGNALFIDIHGNHSIESSNYGTLVCVRGKVMRGGERELEVDLGQDTIRAYAGEGTVGFAAVEPESEIELTGIVTFNSDLWREGKPFPHITDVAIVTRRDEDVKVVSGPPWWTPTKVFAAFAGFILLVAGLAVWNRILMRVAAKRSHELAREQLAKERSELKTGERTRLAIELHDSLSQNLSGLGCQLVATRLALKPGDVAYTRLETAEQMLLSTRTELKRCLFDLREDLLEDMDFEHAIRQTLKSILGGCDLKLRFQVARSVMDDSQAHTILSVVRELVSNAIHHGRATAVRVAGAVQYSGETAESASDRRILLSVRDNGTGFDPESAAGPATGHFGLTGVRDRINRCGGEFRIKSGHTGTYARISIPL